MEIPSASTAQVANPSNSRQSLANTSNEVKELNQVAPATTPSERVQTDSGSSIPAVDNSQASRSASNQQEPANTRQDSSRLESGSQESGSQESLLNAVESQIQQANIERQISQSQVENQNLNSNENRAQQEAPVQSATLETPEDTSVEQGNDIQDEIEALS